MRAVRYEAAGGVVVDTGRVLVLRRPSRNEVRLPKGHVEKGESAQETALREVAEESGYVDLGIIADLGLQTVEFDYRGDHVIRDEHYFLMGLRSSRRIEREEKELQFIPDWLSWDEALSPQGLTFKVEREWVRRAWEVPNHPRRIRIIRQERTMTMQPLPKWARYQELRPDQLAEVIDTSPIVFWPLGLLEHHGWHLPVGLDGLKAEHICIRIAERTGGVILPTMWWGARGGHGDFMWTLYQSEEAAKSILAHTMGKLIAFGFRAIVLLAGHYPWRQILDEHLPMLQETHPEILFLWGTEMDIGGEVHPVRCDGLPLPGDHAAREETSYGLALFPELIDLGALRPGRDASAWPGGQSPPVETWHPGVCFDPADPLFAQMGQDARTATAERGKEAIARLVERLAAKIDTHLGRKSSTTRKVRRTTATL